MSQGSSPRDRRTEILEIAEPLFLENGYQGTSMSQIAAAVGGSKGTLYSYFENKEALFEACMQLRVQAKASAVFAMPDPSGDLSEVLTLLGKRFLKLITEASSVTLLRLLYHESPRFPEIGRIFYKTCILPGSRQLAAYLALADQKGLLDIPDPAMAAEQFLRLCESDLVMPVMLCVTSRISKEDADRGVSSAVSTFLAAYRPKSTAAVGAKRGRGR